MTVVALRQELYHVASVTRKNVYQTQNVKISRNRKTNEVVINVLAENFELARGLPAQPPANKLLQTYINIEKLNVSILKLEKLCITKAVAEFNDHQ